MKHVVTLVFFLVGLCGLSLADEKNPHRPVIGLRTSNHAFKYLKDVPRYEWNHGFGRRALAGPYIVHQADEKISTWKIKRAGKKKKSKRTPKP